MDSLLRDLRYALRALVHAPGFTMLTILCLALGIGINSTVFSVADTTLFRPLPFTEPERLVALYATQLANSVDRSSTSYVDYIEWQAQSRSYSEIGAHSYRSLSLTEGIESERFLGSAVSANLFSMLGVEPVLGRPFHRDDDAAGAPPVVMLSHGLWQRRFAGAPSVVGRAIIVDGSPHTVVGVMPPKFQFPQNAQLWVPLTPLEHQSTRGQRTVNPIGRLAPTMTPERAGNELAAIATRLATTYREDDGWSARVGTLRDDLMPATVQVAAVGMLGAVAMVLLVACANVANLLLARATARQREMAIRSALGAGRGRVVRQLLTESVLLGILSAPLGVAIAHAGLTAITASTPAAAALPYYVDWSMNGRVLFYTVVVSLATGILFGLAPAWQIARHNLFGSLKDGGRGTGGSRSRNRLRNTIVVAEVALSLVLLVGASLFVRSYLNIQSADGGIDGRSLLTLRVFMVGEAYDTPDAVTRRAEDIVRRVEALPGVTAAFASNLVPLGSGGASGGVVVEGAAVEPGKEPRVQYFGATSHSLHTMEQALLAGRNFTDAESGTRARVALVNLAFAKRLWPGRDDHVGRRFRLLSAPSEEWLTVIGVVTNFHTQQLRDRSTVQPLAILPFPYQALRDTGVTIRVEGAAPASVTAAVRRAIGQSDPSLALFNVQTGEALREARAWGARVSTWMFSIFGAVALFLAAIGLYGVLGYSVAQRTQEFGLQVALGATPGTIVRQVIGQGVRLAAIGTAFGALGALGVTRVVRSILYNVTPTDPISFAGTALLLTAVTVVAGYVPARRATKVDPMVALRAE